MNPQVLNDKQPLSTEPQSSKPDSPVRHSSDRPPQRRSFQLRLLKKLLDTFGQPQLVIELPGGEQIHPPTSNQAVVGRIRFVDSGALWRVLSDPMFQFGEMHAAGRILIEGKIEEVTVEIFHGLQRAGNRMTPLMRLFSWVHWPRGTTRPDVSLEVAQIAKFDHVCRKLRLGPNMEVIEAGCGWGGLALHMARHYGVRVQAYNISHQQIVHARQRASAEGLDGRVEFIEADWRTIRGSCDVFVSVGMLEHVGRPNYRRLGQVIHRALKPGGRGLIHSIGQNFPEPVSPWIERRIFPGGYPPALSEMMDIFQPNGFSVLDVENIRLHYAQTLQHWLDRFRQNEDKVRAMFDERFVRMWRFYLAGSLAAFATGSYQLFQVVFNRAAGNDLAWTRDYLYRDGVSPMPADSQPTFPQPRDY
jgi:cyclopropane-fatty-acyl-phospholipid synthase